MSQQKQPEDSQIKDVLEYLVQRSGKNLKQIADECGIPYQTLYNIRSRASSRTSLQTLKKLADYFGEDLSIFLGLQNYERPVKLLPRERKLLEGYRNLSDSVQARIDEMMEDTIGNPKNLRKGR